MQIVTHTTVQDNALNINAEAHFMTLEEIDASQDLDALRAIASNPDAPTKTLNKIVSKNISALHDAVAKNPNTSGVALRFIATVSKDTVILLDVAKHANANFDVTEALLSRQQDMLNTAIAKYAPLNEKQFVTLWGLGGNLISMILTNPHLSSSMLEQLAGVVDEKELVIIALHPNASETFLAKLGKSGTVAVKQSVASNPNTPESTLSRLSKESRGNVYFYVAQNPSASQAILNALKQADSISVRRAVASNPSTSVEALTFLAKDNEPTVRLDVAQNKNTPLPCLKQLASDRSPTVSQGLFKNPRIGIISELKGFRTILVNSGYGAFSFYDQQSPKKATQLLINSKHPNEVEYLFGSKDAEALDALSALQSAFTNHKGKLNRADYLTFLADVNANVRPDNRVGLAVDNISLMATFKYFGEALIIKILRRNASDEAKDCFRMLAGLVRFEDPKINSDNVERINKWLETHGKKGASLHTYLTALNAELLQSDALPFWQNCLLNQLPEAKKLLDAGMRLNFPTNPAELLEIGSSQRHCVGTKFYAERCVDGSNIIFQVAPKDDMKHGFTFQFNRAGRLLQAKGFANSAVPAHMTKLGKEIFICLNKSTN